MIVNDQDKYIIDYYTPKESKPSVKTSPNEICKNILNNYESHSSNENNLYDLSKWDEYKDNVLRQLVLFYNFDFEKIAQIFDKICKIKRETDECGDEIPVFNEKILRYHWSFLHTRRYFGKKTGEDFYILNKDENFDKNDEKEKSNKNKKEIGDDKIIVNTVNVKELNNETNLEKFYDKLLRQKIDEDRTKIFEMELKENENKNDFPIFVGNKNEKKNVESIINEIKNYEIREAEKNEEKEKQNKEFEE